MSTRPKQWDRGNIYLSGGIQFAEKLGTGWRAKTSEVLKEMKYFPMDISELDSEYQKKFGKPPLPQHEDEHLLYKAQMRKHFVETDLKLIEENCDALIVYYDESARRGAGTVSEAQFAYNKDIPIFLVAEYDSLVEMHKNVSGWLIALSTKTFTNFEDLYAYLEKLPYGILNKDLYGNRGVANDYLCDLSGEVFTKRKSRFVSQINPLYSQESVDIVHKVYEETEDRYSFFMKYLSDQTGTDFK